MHGQGVEEVKGGYDETGRADGVHHTREIATKAPVIQIALTSKHGYPEQD
jgi:hypothetical protein